MNLISRGLDLRKFDANTFASAALRAPSAGAGSDARFLEGKLAEIAEHRFTRAEQAKLTVGGDASLKVRLFDTLAALKVHTSSVAMHLRDDWRLRLFRQLDNLLSSGDWLDEDVPPHIGSFATFIRIILSLRPEQQPGLAATSDGNLIASWTTAEGDRLTLECQPLDRVRWIVSRDLPDGPETAAGSADIRRLPDVLAPYAPARWLA